MSWEPPIWLGKARGFMIYGLVAFFTLVVLVTTKVLQGSEFVTSLGILLTTFFGGSAAAAYRK